MEITAISFVIKKREESPQIGIKPVDWWFMSLLLLTGYTSSLSNSGKDPTVTQINNFLIQTW